MSPMERRAELEAELARLTDEDLLFGDLRNLDQRRALYERLHTLHRYDMGRRLATGSGSPWVTEDR